MAQAKHSNKKIWTEFFFISVIFSLLLGQIFSSKQFSMLKAITFSRNFHVAHKEENIQWTDKLEKNPRIVFKWVSYYGYWLYELWTTIKGCFFMNVRRIYLRVQHICWVGGLFFMCRSCMNLLMKKPYAWVWQPSFHTVIMKHVRFFN